MTIAAVRTVSETDDVHIIEGLGIPFGGAFDGRDSYGTYASIRTDFAWDLFPDDAADPKFVRPVTYNHGFDDTIGLRRIGGWSPVRTDEAGVWVRAQLDKRDKYYSEYVRPLLDANGLGFSSGSVEHSVRIDGKTGEWQTWPAWDLALTPTESNPLAVIATRTAEFSGVLAVVRTIREEDGKYVLYSKDGTKKLGTFDTEEEAKKREGQVEYFKAQDATKSAVRAAAGDLGLALSAQGMVATLMDVECNEPEQFAMLRAAFDALSSFVAAESAEIGTPEDQMRDGHSAYMSGVRAGKRNSASDQSLIQAMHDGAHDLHDHTTALGADCAGPMDGDGAAERSAEAQPALAVRADVDPAIRTQIIDFAKSTAAEIVGT